MAAGRLVGLAAVGGLRDDLDVGVAGEQGGEACAYHRVVVRDHDPEGGAGAERSCRSGIGSASFSRWG